MLGRTLNRIRDLIRRELYVITAYADEEMDADDLSVFDVERCVFTGKIVHRQKELETNETKYLISGESVEGRSMAVVVKFGRSGRMLYIITVYEE